jgi:hypothetical protein
MSSKRFTFTLTTDSPRSVITSVIQSGFILQSFILHSYCTLFSARFLSSVDLNPPSELPVIKLIKICSILMVEETGVPGGNHRYVIRAENPFYTVQLI